MSITPAKKAPRARLWNSLSTQCIVAGMTLRQNGDAEGALTFQPDSPVLVKLALQLAVVKHKRQPSATQLANLTKGVPFQKASTMPIEASSAT